MSGKCPKREPGIWVCLGGTPFLRGAALSEGWGFLELQWPEVLGC